MIMSVSMSTSSAALHARYDQKNLRAGRRGVVEKTFLGKARLERQPVWFLAGYSTIDVSGKLKKLCASAIKKCQFGAAVSLDSQNKFNSMPWMRILNAKVPVYLLGITWDYAASGVVRKEMACGVLQGSVLGPLLWNITFDNILKEEVSLRVSIICYAKDTLVVTAEDDIPMLEWKVIPPLRL